MEEIEGLIELSTIRSSRRNRAFQSNSAVIGTVAGKCSNKYRGRWKCVVLLVVTVLIALLIKGTRDIEAEEGEGGSHVSDKEGEDHGETTLSPTQSPATSPPTNLPETTTPTQLPASTPETKTNDRVDATPSKGYAWPLTPFAVRTENPPPQAVLDEYANTWGTWQLGELPKMDRDVFCGAYPHCDVPRDEFPPDTWQADSAFVTKFLDEAEKLVDRAMHAILAEYGKSPDDTIMFDLTYMDLKHRELREQPTPDNGGWTTKRSMQGLSRRLLHAIMTRDTFTFIMGGHSAAAGHG